MRRIHPNATGSTPAPPKVVAKASLKHVADKRHACARVARQHGTPVPFAALRKRGASFWAAPSRATVFLLTAASMSSRSWLASGTVAPDGLSSARFRRLISRLPATLHDEIREQIDRPSTLVTDWLNLHTPVGREYVGHRRVNHERRVRPRSQRSTSPRPVPIAGSVRWGSIRWRCRCVCAPTEA